MREDWGQNPGQEIVSTLHAIPFPMDWHLSPQEGNENEMASKVQIEWYWFEIQAT